MRGVVLETYGAGNAPQRADIMTALREACDRGVVVVAISQCAKGSVSDAYETGRTLLQVGVVPGADMTPEVKFLGAPLNHCTHLNTCLVCPEQTQLPLIKTGVLCGRSAPINGHASPRRAYARDRGAI